MKFESGIQGTVVAMETQEFRIQKLQLELEISRRKTQEKEIELKLLQEQTVAKHSQPSLLPLNKISGTNVVANNMPAQASQNTVR